MTLQRQGNVVWRDTEFYFTVANEEIVSVARLGDRVVEVVHLLPGDEFCEGYSKDQIGVWNASFKYLRTVNITISDLDSFIKLFEDVKTFISKG